MLNLHRLSQCQSPVLPPIVCDTEIEIATAKRQSLVLASTYY